MPMYRSMFPDYIGLVTPQGEKFNFTGQLLDTDNPQWITVLNERVNRFKDVIEISADEADKLRQSYEAEKKVTNLEEAISSNPQGEMTISPQELLRRVQLTQEAEKRQIESAQLAAATLNPQAGIVGSNQLESTQAAESTSTPAATGAVTRPIVIAKK